MIRAYANGAAELYHNGTKTFQTTNFGAEVIFTSGGGNEAIFKVLHSNLSQGIAFGYNTIAATGTNTNVDLRLESKGSGLVYAIDTLQAQAGVNVTGSIVVSGGTNESPVTVTTSNDYVGKFESTDAHARLIVEDNTSTTGHNGLQVFGNTCMLVAGNAFSVRGIGGGATELLHAGTKKFETTTAGIDVTGTITMDAVPGTNTNAALPVLFQTSAGVIDGGSQLTYNPGGDVLKVNGLTLSNTQIRTSGSSALQLTTANANGTVDLYVRTTHVECNGNLLPATNNTDDIGSTSLRWRNVYTNDLNLSNEGNSNDVDGTWGNYTIQEGEDDLFLINRRSGKKYKFNLTEVS